MTIRQILLQRYVDDVFLVFADELKLEDFFKWVDILHPTIKFTTHRHKQSIIFLDTEVYRNSEGRLSFRTFTKPNDRNMLLNYTSFHTYPLWENLPYILYIKRKSSQSVDYVQDTNKPVGLLTQRGYPMGTVSQVRMRPNAQPREEFLKQNPLGEMRQFTFALQYTPLANAIKRAVFEYWYLVESFVGGSQPRAGLKKPREHQKQNHQSGSF